MERAVTLSAEDPVFPLVRRGWSTLAACLAVCAAYSAVGAAGIQLLHRILEPGMAAIAPTLGLPWLPVGIGVGGLLVFGTRAWPGVFAGSCIVWGVVQRDVWGTVLIDAAGETLSIVLITRMLVAWHYRPSVSRYQDALLLIFAAALGRLLSSGIDIGAAVAAPWLETRTTYHLVLEAAGVVRSGNSLTVSSACRSKNNRRSRVGSPAARSMATSLSMVLRLTYKHIFICSENS